MLMPAQVLSTAGHPSVLFAPLLAEAVQHGVDPALGLATALPPSDVLHAAVPEKDPLRPLGPVPDGRGPPRALLHEQVRCTRVCVW